MSPQVRSNLNRFRRTPSRCQIFWQGIVILATLALAIAANAQSAALCYDVFASKNAPLRPGSSVTLQYSFTEASAAVFSKPDVRAEIHSSSVRESHRLQEEASRLRQEFAALEAKHSKAAIARKAEILGALKVNRTQMENVLRIENLAEAGQPLQAADVLLLRSQTFHQTIVLNGRKQAALLSQRLVELNENLAAVEKVNLPPGRVKRVYRVAMKHKILTLILVSVMAGLGQQGYDLYVAHQADVNAPIVTQIYDEGTGSAPLAPARDNPGEAVGN